MSLDRSLKSANSLVRHRNVLTRGERLQRLQDEEKWNDSKPVFGLPKVANRKLSIAKEKAEATAEGAAAAGTPGATPAAGAAGAAPAAGAKGAAPAAGAKGAATGAKGAAPAGAPAGKAAAAPAKKK